MVLWSTVLHSTACIPHLWSKIGSTLICSSPLTGRIQRISGFCDDVLYKLMIDNYIDICTCVVFMFHFMLSTKWHLYRVPLYIIDDYILHWCFHTEYFSCSSETAVGHYLIDEHTQLTRSGHLFMFDQRHFHHTGSRSRISQYPASLSNLPSS